MRVWLERLAGLLLLTVIRGALASRDTWQHPNLTTQHHKPWKGNLQ
jgi:hypothetical protein